MLPVAPYPFLRLALFFTGGIAAFIHYQIFCDYLEWIASSLVAIYCVLFFLKTKQNELFLGTAAFAFCFFFGALVCKWDTEILDPNHFSQHEKNTTSYLAVVDDELVGKPTSYSSILRVKAVYQEGKWIQTNGKILAYFSRDATSEKLKYGDWLVVGSKPKRTEGPKNPGEFDYKRFLFFKSIYHQHFVTTTDYVVLGNKPDSRIWQLAYWSRKKLAEHMQSVMGKGQEFAVASMLILGIRQTIDFDLYNAYSGAGAIHVLAVSGMHVGLIFALVQLLLGRFARNKIASIFFYSSSLLAIWLFGLVTAFSPSVLRAVVMFSVVILAKWTRQKSNLFNTLGFTAFAILLESPYTLMSVGFQMSFMAVLGIAYFHPVFLTVLRPKSWLGRSVWEITCISLAAQITTSPLALLYFKQFPTYFLLSNLWVIPASTCILYLGILFFVCSFVWVLKIALGHLLTISVLWLNKSMFLVLLLPNAVYKSVYFDDWEILVLYVMLLMVVLVFRCKDRRYLVGAILLSILFSCSRMNKARMVKNRRSTVVYSIPNTTCLANITGSKAVIYSSKSFLNNKSALDFHVLHPLAGSGIVDFQFKELPTSNFIYKNGEASILVLQQKNSRLRAYGKLKQADFLLFAYRPTNLADIALIHQYKNVILQTSTKQNTIFPDISHLWNLQTDGALELYLAPNGKYTARDKRQGWHHNPQ